MYIRYHQKTFYWKLTATICLVVMLSLITGCANNREIIQQVETTNKILLESTIPQLEAANKTLLDSTLPSEVLPDNRKKVIEPWQVPSARIDAYIAAHPDNIPTASALRIRQAMLLLAYKQYHLAGAAFDQATELHLARDRALRALKKELIWWFKVDQERAPGNEVDDVIRAFSDQIAILSGDSENESIRDYLAEMRAWIQLYAASHAVNGKMMAKDIASAMDLYAETLTEDDITAINTGNTTPGLGPVSLQVRRQIRAMEVIKRAAEIVDDPQFDGATVVYESEKARQIKVIN